MGRKTIKRGPGKRHIEGKDCHLADEIRYIQRRAAEHDGRFVTVGSLALFSTDTGVPGCLTRKTTWRRAWRGTAIRKMSTLRRRARDLQSAGKANTESTEARSSTSTRIPAVSSPPWATPSAALRNGVDRKISNMFGYFLRDDP